MGHCSFAERAESGEPGGRISEANVRGKFWESISGGRLFAGDKAFMIEQSLVINAENLASRDNSQIVRFVQLSR